MLSTKDNHVFVPEREIPVYILYQYTVRGIPVHRYGRRRYGLKPDLRQLLKRACARILKFGQALRTPSTVKNPPKMGRFLWRWGMSYNKNAQRGMKALPVVMRTVPGGSVRGERANFTRLVLGCIEAKFCK